MILTDILSGARFDVPVEPDAPDARELLIRELSKPEYQTSQPSLWDLLAKAFWDWVTSLRVPGDGPFASLFPIIIAAVLVTGVVVAFLLWGVPRLNRRSRHDSELFGEHDARTSGELRKAANAAAAKGDWTRAVQELYRAVARSLSERTVVAVMPGTTAHGFANRAAAAFPAERERLYRSADVFDGVRYLGATGTEAQYAELEALDRALAAAAPAVFDEPAEVHR